MWRLKVAEDDPLLTTTNNHVGRQHWEFDPNAGTREERENVEKMRDEFKRNRFKNKQSADLLMRIQLTKENRCGPLLPPARVMDLMDITEEAVMTTFRRSISFYSSVQAHDGHWPAESAGPMFFLPPLVMALYVTGDLNSVLSPEHQKEIICYHFNHQNEDGGWGFHIEGDSTMFGSALSYICLRLLGVGPNDGDDMAMAKGRKWILDHGGLASIPSWGKFWVSVLGLYEWLGCNPLPPEFWLLPEAFPIHPGNMLCYCRLVYMPMSYLYGKRFVGRITGLIQSLRHELYNEPYHQINWNKARSTIAKEDLYYPHPLIQDLTWSLLYHVAEPLLKTWPFSMFRKQAIKKAIEHVHYEDVTSRYLCIGSVEKVLCLMACWVEDPNSEAYKRHLARLPDYYWIAEDGLKMQTFGSQMWDAGFAIQAIMSSNLSEEYATTLRKAHDFVKASQVRENPSGDFKAMYRHISKGSWTFSMQDHGWQVSDCTAEGLKCCLLFSQMSPDIVGEKIEAEWLYDSVNVLLSLQKFNPTEFFEDTLIEREYVECSGSAIQGLAMFRKFYPGHRRKEIDTAIAKGIQYIEETQNPDGSWYGCWGICYTYGTWFAVGALAACKRHYRNSPAMRKACEFLLSKQLPCGGWGESYLSSKNKAYTNLEGDRANLVQTSWALLSLIEAGQEITGVFMRNCTLNYSSYRNTFPIWALGEYKRYGCWGICYTYGTGFAMGTLAACKRHYRNSPAMRKACEFCYRNSFHVVDGVRVTSLVGIRRSQILKVTEQTWSKLLEDGQVSIHIIAANRARQKMWRLKIAEDGPLLTTTNNHVGRQHWEFDPNAGTCEERENVEKMRDKFKRNRFKNKQSADLLMRMQLTKENWCGPILPPTRVMDLVDITEEAVTTTVRRSISFFSSIQAHDGHWPAESAGPMFFLPPLVMALYVTGDLNSVLSSEHRKEIIRYYFNHQNEDGGWGFHIEGDSTMFGSALSYICLRLLGVGSNDGDDMAMAKGRKWILDHGGLASIPSWGKFWASILGLYEWSGCNPLPPEFWLLPQAFPIHPGNMLCLSRLVYMPMSYLYGKRFVGRITDLIQSLRHELYNEPYHQINWNKARSTIAKEDLYYPHPLIQDLTWSLLYHVAEPLLKTWPFSMFRKQAIKKTIEHVHYEDVTSRYLCIGSVEKVLCLMACWVEDPNSEAYKRHLARLPDYYWIAEDGLKMQSIGSQTWDAGFAIQAIMSSNLSEEYATTLRKAHDFVKVSQVRENPSGDFKAMYRHISKGSWTFAMQDHGWQVSDCTAEGLKCCLLFSQMSPDTVGEKIETEWLYDSVNVILSLQSKNGGFSAWEPQRAYSWLEKFNPTEFFEDTLIEREYVECSGSAIQGLAMFRKFYPGHRRKEIDTAIAKGIQYIEETQNSDGSWYGCWGICYTYGTWFAVGALAACQRHYRNSPAMRKACEFLLSKQLPCGGWGESYLSSKNKVYTNLEGDRANLVQTSWALLSLIEAGQADVDPTPIHRGIKVLINSQMDDGDFPQEEITGVFMRNCTLNYSSYRNIFPIWALGEYKRHVLFA